MKDRGMIIERVLLVLLALPVALMALILAPYDGMGIVRAVKELDPSKVKDIRIVWCDSSLKYLVIFLLVYLAACLIYLSTKEKARPGTEFGSSKWGSARAVSKLMKKGRAFPISENIWVGDDMKAHRRNLNMLVIGGSGSGKTRTIALPGIINNADMSLLITDPKDAIM